jgi:hypothetical protein
VVTIDLWGVYYGPPTRARIHMIQALTTIDRDGKRYWRKSVNEGWRRLRTDEDLRQLNEALSRLVEHFH